MDAPVHGAAAEDAARLLHVRLFRASSTRLPVLRFGAMLSPLPAVAPRRYIPMFAIGTCIIGLAGLLVWCEGRSKRRAIEDAKKQK